MNETDLAYVAGMFDGEGCILIVKQHPERNTFRLDVRVTSTDFPLLESLKENFGGWVGNQPDNKNVKKCRRARYWAASSKTAFVFLKKIAPFLRIKKEQAGLAIEFQERIEKVGVNELEPSEVLAREGYKARLSALKNPQPQERIALSGLSQSEKDVAYAAGMLDGDGTILVCSAKTSHWLSVRITNTDRFVLEQMKSFFGGGIGSKNDGQKRTRPCWDWSAQGKGAASFLGKVLPYLTIKRNQAILALEFQKRKIELKDSGTSMNEKVALGEEYKKRISDLNQRRFVA